MGIDFERGEGGTSSLLLFVFGYRDDVSLQC